MAPPMIVRDDLTWAGGCWVDKQEGIADILFDQADGSRLRVRLPLASARMVKTPALFGRHKPRIFSWRTPVMCELRDSHCVTGVLRLSPVWSCRSQTTTVEWSPPCPVRRA